MENCSEFILIVIKQSMSEPKKIIVIGAGWAGARSLTATSGPGISLMSEFAGLAYFAEIPFFVINSFIKNISQTQYCQNIQEKHI